MSASHYTYPFLMMNHHAVLLYMIRKNLKFLQQVEKKIGMPVRMMPPELNTEPNKPNIILFKGPDKREPISFRALLYAY